MPGKRKPCQGDDSIDSACAYCSLDMDMDFFCVHPNVLKNHPYGLYLRNVRKPGGICEGGKLWEPRTEN